MSALSPADIQRGRDYLRADSRLPIEEVIDRIDAAQGKLAEVAGRASRDTLDRQVDGQWSVRQTLTHVVDWTIRASQQVLYVALSGELPAPSEISFPATPDELLARQREALDSLYAHVREADPGAFPDVTWEHPVFGPLNWREWFLFLELHCIDHARQIGAAVG